MIFARQAGENTPQQLFFYSNLAHFKYQKIGSRYHEAGSGKLAARSKERSSGLLPLVNQ